MVYLLFRIGKSRWGVVKSIKGKGKDFLDRIFFVKGKWGIGWYRKKGWDVGIGFL